MSRAPALSCVPTSLPLRSYLLLCQFLYHWPHQLVQCGQTLGLTKHLGTQPSPVNGAILSHNVGAKRINYWLVGWSSWQIGLMTCKTRRQIFMDIRIKVSSSSIYFFKLYNDILNTNLNMWVHNIYNMYAIGIQCIQYDRRTILAKAVTY